MRHLAQDVEYIGTIANNLRDLEGKETLAFELIQNADDDASASSICFDVTEEALTVENDGEFTDCGQVREDSCPFEQEKGFQCDFHRFRNLASRGKRREENTTGTFGIGFISVYQITDRPELQSGYRHWTIRPDADRGRRIIEKELASRRDGTEFYLPWAKDPTSELRQALEADPISDSYPAKLAEVLASTLPKSLLFLRNLTSIELCRNHETVLKAWRRSEGNRRQIITERNGAQRTSTYMIEERNFRSEARQLVENANSANQEEKSPRVEIAVPIDNTSEIQSGGRYYAYLPTRHPTGLPFHIQADFFPSSDRRRIVFDGGFRNKWNRLATRQSYEAFRSLLPRLKEEAEPPRFWKILNEVYQSRNPEGDLSNEPPPECWKKLKPCLREGEYVFTGHERWRRAEETYLPRKNIEQIERLADVLDILDIEVPISKIRSYQNLLQEIGSRRLTISVVVERFESFNIEEGTSINEAPEWMQDPRRYAAVFQLTEKLYQSLSSSDEELVDRLRKLPLALSTNGRFHTFENVRRVGRPDYLGPLSQLNSKYLFLAPDLPSEVLDFVNDAGLVEKLKIEDVYNILCGLSESELDAQWTDSSSSLAQLIRGLLEHDKLRGGPRKKKLRSSLRNLPIWPVGDGYSSLDNVVIPGGFEDPLEISKVLAGPAVRSVGRKIEDILGVPRLNFERYVTEELPRAFDEETIGVETRRETVKLLARKLGKLQAIDGTREALSECPIALCKDGEHRPPKEVYFEETTVRQILGENVSYVAEELPHPAASDLYGEVGVASNPRPRDVAEHIKDITEAPPTSPRRRQIKNIIDHLAEHRSENLEEFGDLKHLDWLPVEGDDENWHSPEEVYTPEKKRLFRSQGQFIDVRNRTRARPVFRFLDLETDPTTEQIVDHLLNCAQEERPPKNPDSIYGELSTRLQRDEGSSAENQVRRLRGEQALHVPSVGFCEPKRVFRSDHPFGQFRHRIKGRPKYSAFLNSVGVKQDCDEKDAVDVLEEIANEQNATKESLSSNHQAVLLSCWKICAEKGLSEELIDRLEEKPVVLTTENSLVTPNRAFFDDHPSLPSSIETFFEGHLVKRDPQVAGILQEVGIRSVRDVLGSQLAENPHAKPDQQMTERLQRRAPLIQRVLSGGPFGENVESRASLVRNIEAFRSTKLSVITKASALGQEKTSEAKSRKAFLDSDSNRLHVTAENGNPDWVSIAREIASFLVPREEPAQLASHLDHVLRPSSLGSAERRLDELGFPEIQTQTYEPVGEESAIQLGEKEAQDTSQSPPITDDDSEDLHRLSENGQNVDTEEEANTGGEPQLGGDGNASATPRTGLPSGASSEQEGSEVNRGEETSRSPEEKKTKPESSSAEETVDEETSASEEASSSKSEPETQASEGGTSSGENEPETTGELSGTEKSGHNYRDLKLRSYVRRESTSQSGGNSQGSGQSEEINRAGIKTVLAHERDQSRVPKEQGHYNEGYDIKSFDEDGNLLRYIEVKSTDGPWDGYGVGLSSSQFEMAQEEAHDYWLYVVEHARSEFPEVTCIQNPTSKVSEYRFDDEWQKLDEDEQD